MKLLTSGYGRDQMQKILLNGIKGYMSKRARRKENGRRRIHNTSEESKMGRIKKKLLGKTNWYKKRTPGDGHEKPKGGRRMNNKQEDTLKTGAVLFVEQTPQGELARRLKELLQRLETTIGQRLRIQAEGGGEDWKEPPEPPIPDLPRPGESMWQGDLCYM